MKKLVCSLAAVFLVFLGGELLAEPAGAIDGPPSQPVCVKVKTDWRAPYAGSGLCPEGFAPLNIFAWPSSGYIGDGYIDVCTKASLDWRAPGKDNLCPAGFARYTVPTYGNFPVCVKVDLDWRAPYADGTCPLTFALYWVYEVSNQPT